MAALLHRKLLFPILFTYDKVNQLDIIITNKKDLIDVAGDIITVKFSADDEVVDIVSLMRRIRVVLYVGNSVIDQSSILSVTAGNKNKVDLSLGGANEAVVIIYDEDTKDQLDKAKVIKSQMRDLDGLL